MPWHAWLHLILTITLVVCIIILPIFQMQKPWVTGVEWLTTSQGLRWNRSSLCWLQHLRQVMQPFSTSLSLRVSGNRAYFYKVVINFELGEVIWNVRVRDLPILCLAIYHVLGRRLTRTWCISQLSIAIMTCSYHPQKFNGISNKQ